VPANGGWQLTELEDHVAAHADEYPERADEWRSYLFFLRDYAEPDGSLPANFDSLIEDETGLFLARQTGSAEMSLFQTFVDGKRAQVPPVDDGAGVGVGVGAGVADGFGVADGLTVAVGFGERCGPPPAPPPPPGAPTATLGSVANAPTSATSVRKRRNVAFI